MQVLYGCKNDQCDDACPNPYGLCGSDLMYASSVLTQCITDHCCADFDPCYANPACHACLQDPDGAGCDTNQLFADYLACKEAQCPTTMCDTDLGYWDQDDPMIDCNLCGDANCCTSLNLCVGDGGSAAVDLCWDCINGDPGCTDVDVQAAAAAFTQCLQTHCSGDCG